MTKWLKMILVLHRKGFLLRGLLIKVKLSFLVPSQKSQMRGKNLSKLTLKTSAKRKIMLLSMLKLNLMHFQVLRHN